MIIAFHMELSNQLWSNRHPSLIYHDWFEWMIEYNEYIHKTNDTQYIWKNNKVGFLELIDINNYLHFCINIWSELHAAPILFSIGN